MLANMMRKMNSMITPRMTGRLISLWRPYRGAGIKVEDVSSDFRYVRVILKRKWYNSNYVGTQFGGSIYAMTDPFFMLMLMNIIGNEYLVWDKGATIDFVSPGRTKLTAEFRITDEILKNVKLQTASGEKYIFDLPVEVLDADGKIVATVLKKLYVRKKKEFRNQN